MAAGYSGTSLAKKLGLSLGKKQHVFLVRAPADFERLLEGLPDDARLTRRSSSAMPDVIVAFVRSAAELEGVLERWAGRFDGGQMLWIAWPKKASDVTTDLTEDVIRRLALPRKLVDVKVCAIDETWSGLKLVRRARERSRR